MTHLIQRLHREIHRRHLQICLELMGSIRTIRELRVERPDLSDEQLWRREQRFRLVAHLRMFGRWPADAQEPPDHPDDMWADEQRLESLLQS